MKGLLLLALSVHILEAFKGGDHKRSNVGKRSKNKVKQRHTASRPSASGSRLYLIETLDRHHKKRGENILQKKKDGQDYQNIEWIDKCSLKGRRKGEKKQLNIPGCGGWVQLHCPEGCIAIQKVLRFVLL